MFSFWCNCDADEEAPEGFAASILVGEFAEAASETFGVSHADPTRNKVKSVSKVEMLPSPDPHRRAGQVRTLLTHPPGSRKVDCTPQPVNTVEMFPSPNPHRRAGDGTLKPVNQVETLPSPNPHRRAGDGTPEPVNKVETLPSPDLHRRTGDGTPKSVSTPTSDPHRRAGQLCTHLTPPLGERAVARYRVDEQAGCFILELGEGFDVSLISCHVSDIEDIYQISDGEACFPASILASIALHERNSLLMLVMRDPVSQKPISICLLEESRCGLQAFLSRLGKLLSTHAKDKMTRSN